MRSFLTPALTLLLGAFSLFPAAPASAQTSSDATLTSLTISSSTSASGTFSDPQQLLILQLPGEDPVPNFVDMATTITHVKLTPTVTDTGKARVKAGLSAGVLADVDDGQASDAIKLLPILLNEIVVEVTAEDNITTNTYTVFIAREAPPPGPPPTAPPNIRIKPGDRTMTMTWDAQSWTAWKVDVRWRVKDTDPSISGDQAGDWIPGVEGATVTDPQLAARSVPIPPWDCIGCDAPMNGKIYEVEAKFYRAPFDGGGETDWVPLPAVALNTVSPEESGSTVRVTAPDGSYLILPQAHAAHAAAITITAATETPDAPPGFRLGDTAVDITGVTLGDGETAIVCLPTAETGETSVQRWDEAQEKWVALAPPPGGPRKGFACGVTDHFSRFMVMVWQVRQARQARQAWLARIGRTMAGHVADAVGERLSAAPAAEAKLDLGSMAGVGGRAGPNLGQALANSSFVLPLASGGTRNWTAWGRGAYTEFDGRESGMETDGEVLTGTVGVDGEYGRWRLGLALSHSEGDGEVRAAESRDDLESRLTGMHPYASYEMEDGLTAWGVLGWGEGELERRADGEVLETDIEMRMVAFGLEGSLGTVQSAYGPFELALKSDLLAVRVEADAQRVVARPLPEVEADAQRVRLRLEGSGDWLLDSGAMLWPTLEAGLRLDGGDAETGLGAELGAGLRYADTSGRLSADLSARGLLVHEDSDYEEWGVSGALALAPDAAGSGLSLSLRQSWGALPSDGMGARLRGEMLSSLAERDATTDFKVKSRLEGEIGYGLPTFGGAFIGMPNLGFGLSGGGARDWRIGWRLAAARSSGLALEASLDATRRETTNRNGSPRYGLAFRGSVHW